MSVRAWVLVATLGAAACGPAPDAKEKQIEALGEVAERYRAPAGGGESEEGGERQEPSGEADGAPQGLPGWSDYEAAKDAVAASDWRRAVASLERATAVNDECAEYWYNLGAAQANLAVFVVHEDEGEAIQRFRESVDSKRRARDLMDQGRFQFYDESAQAQVRSDVENALEGVDELLADESLLVTALRMSAGG